jgi:hypothetical protein
MHVAALMLSGSVVGLWAFGATFAHAIIHKVSGF